MTEYEKMMSGQIYDCGDTELMKMWHQAKDLARQYNQLPSSDIAAKDCILNKLLGSRGKQLWITPPFYVDYGINIHFGDNCEVNMNCVFLDDNKISVGNNVLIAPSVQIYTAYHPVHYKDRNVTGSDGNFSFCLGQTAPVTIGNNVWIGGGAIIMPGIEIGDNVVIGAGSVVTKSIPADSIAVGNPCKVTRQNKRQKRCSD